MTMCGNLLTGCSDSPSKLTELNGSKYVEYYGSASEFQDGKLNRIEGTKKLIPYKNKTILEQMTFIKNVNKDMYWQEIKSNSLDASLTFKIMNFLLVNKMNIGVLLLGHAIYFIKMHCFWLWRYLR